MILQKNPAFRKSRNGIFVTMLTHELRNSSNSLRRVFQHLGYRWTMEDKVNIETIFRNYVRRIVTISSTGKDILELNPN